jgi:histidine ammonia-lyase
MPHTPPVVSAPIRLDGGSLSPAQVERVAKGGAPIEISTTAMEAVRVSRKVLEGALSDGQAHYGVNTGFGSLSRQRIGDADLQALQRNLIRSHAAGVGRPLEEPIVRAMMLLLAASLCRGCSGVRPVVVERLVAMLNRGVTPVVPEIGSVGASGDLAPLAHTALVLLGEGRATVGGREMAGAEAMRAAGVEPVMLEAKEGLALINGTHLMAARGALLACEFDRLMDAALVAAAMSIDSARATDEFLDERVYRVRNQPGPAAVAARLRGLLKDSQIIPSHRENDTRVQDPYSFRCVAPVLGAAWDAAGYVKQAVQAELGAVTDNPLVFPAQPGSRAPTAATELSLVSAGNFHGLPIAIPLDVLAIAVSHVAGISERRVFFMLSAPEPEMELRPYMSPRPGLHSGLMIAQYTAAACCNEIIGLCTPASVSNIPTSSGMEDYNSFGPRSAAKAARAMELARNVVAIELLCAAEGLEYHRPLKSGTGVERAHAAIRAVVPRLVEDRPLAPDIAAISGLLERGELAIANP